MIECYHVDDKCWRLLAVDQRLYYIESVIDMKFILDKHAYSSRVLHWIMITSRRVLDCFRHRADFLCNFGVFFLSVANFQKKKCYSGETGLWPDSWRDLCKQLRSWDSRTLKKPNQYAAHLHSDFRCNPHVILLAQVLEIGLSFFRNFLRSGEEFCPCNSLEFGLVIL